MSLSKTLISIMMITGLITLFAIGFKEMGIANNVPFDESNMTAINEIIITYNTTQKEYKHLRENLTEKTLTKEENELATGNNLVVAGVKFLNDAWSSVKNIEHLMNSDGLKGTIDPRITLFVIGLIAVLILSSIVAAILRWDT